MKVLESLPISAFGGLNFVLEEFLNLGIDRVIKESLPELPAQCKYTWKDILFSYWSVLFCGGDCAEDIAANLGPSFKDNPFVKAPSPDRLLERLKDLSEPVLKIKKNRSYVTNDISLNPMLNGLNVNLLKKLSAFDDKEIILDYDNTYIFTNKADAAYTYKKKNGYCPGVGIIGSNIVYIENRNGNSAPHAMQDDTIERMFKVLDSQNVKVDIFRADSASFLFSTIATIDRFVDKLYVKARMSDSLTRAIISIDNWKEVEIEGKVHYRGSTVYTPFQNTARKLKQEDKLKEYRLVVTKEPRSDGQMNLFTGEAFVYSAILTNDFVKSNDQIVIFYNQRGKQEKEFDILKNDFAWGSLPFSKIEQNTVFLIITAICRNLYNYIIKKFSLRYKALAPNYRIKKFIFRFICIPAKWVKSSRGFKLRVYGGAALDH